MRAEMANLPTRQEQIVQAHAELIVGVVKAVHNRALLPDLEEALEVTTRNGWSKLVAAIREILKGQRDQSLFKGLDEEDATIVEAILHGIHNPDTLPDPSRQADPMLAAPGLATMINEASKGGVEALRLLANMAEQMIRVGGDMGKLGGLMKRLVDGERDANKLCKGMTFQGKSLVLSILEELGKLEIH
jgi:hypothetical protein